MTKIYFDYEDSKLINSLSDCYSHISNATTFNCNIPSSFQYRSLLKTHINKIKKIKKDISVTKKWYQESQRDFELLELELKTKYNSLSDKKIEKRTSLIK